MHIAASLMTVMARPSCTTVRFGNKLYFTRDIPEGKWVPQASYQEGKTSTQECCPKHSIGKWRAFARVQGEVEQDQEILHRAGQGVSVHWQPFERILC